MAHVIAQNPLTAGLSAHLIPQPCTLVIFGGAGDLSARKLLPAVYNLSLDGVLPANFAIVGFARNELDDSSFRAIRSEEHTSELQSHHDLVCRLLLEKKKPRDPTETCHSR